MLTQGFEPIDAPRRWGGLANISQPMVADLAAMPGQSDMMRPLLRIAEPAGARRPCCCRAPVEPGRSAIRPDHLGPVPDAPSGRATGATQRPARRVKHTA